MSARTAWVYIAAATWLAAVWLGLLGGCGAGVAGDGGPGSGSGSTGDAAPAAAGTATTLAAASAGSPTTTGALTITGSPTTTAPAVDGSGSSATLGRRPITLDKLSAEIRGLLGDSGVPIYLPLALPLGYDVAASPAEDPGGKGNPAAWQLGGSRPGPRTAGYAVLYTDGPHRIRLDVDPAGDLGDVQWMDAGIKGVYGPLRTTTADGTTWVGVANPDGVEIMVSGDSGLSEALLSLASKVARVDAG
jgi:hypothetical protein